MRAGLKPASPFWEVTNMSVTAFNRARREAAAKKAADEASNKTIDKMTVAELKAIAVEKGIEGFDNMKKAELVAAITALGE